MPWHQLTLPVVSRREFLVALAAGAAVSCGGGESTIPGTKPVGRISGDVVDVTGMRQSSLGRIFLMYAAGQQTGRYVDVDPAGRFLLTDVAPGEWQLRFHAPGVAYVPERYQHPVHVTVAANQTIDVHVVVERGWEDGEEMVEIYLGDYFFQEQPFGKENADVTVKIGTPVCWYNVGLTQHTVSGPFWESGVLERTGSFIWVADRVGTFPYFCRFHRSQMIATLRVTT